MTRQWLVTFEGDKPGPADDSQISFEDIVDILGEIPLYKNIFFEKIVENINNLNNYYAWENIKGIEPPEDVPFEKDQYFIVIGIDKNGLRYGLLMVLIGEGIILTGIWPSALAEAIKGDNELLDGIIYALAEQPDFWKEVHMVYAR